MPTAPEFLTAGGGGVFASLATLLALAGLAKIVRPTATAATIGRLPGLKSLGIPAVARAVGVVELLVAAAALAVGNRLAAVLLTACYLAFVVVTVVLLRTAATGLPSADCGCFGATRSPLNRVHLAATIGFTAAAALGIAAPPGPLPGSSGFEVVGGVPFLALVLILTGCGYLLVTALPALADARDRARPQTAVARADGTQAGRPAAQAARTEQG